MALTVGWLLSQADLRLTLAAGSAGVDREIRWAHAIELGDPTPWLSGGELVLTTGMRLPRTTVLRRDYVTRLDEAGARQSTQLQRHGAEGDVRHAAMNVARCQLVAPHHAQDLAPAR